MNLLPTNEISRVPKSLIDLSVFEVIEWDDDENENGNLLHCLRHGVNELVVAEVLRERPVSINLSLKSSEFAIVGPDGAWVTMWTLLFDRGSVRSDWLRPVTGWQSNEAQIAVWRQATRLTWRK